MKNKKRLERWYQLMTANNPNNLHYIHHDILRTPSFSVGFRDGPIDHVKSLEHYHDSYELDLFIKTDIQIFVKDRRYDIHDGDILFISEYDVHKVIYNTGTHYTRYVINFKKNFINELLNFLGIADLLINIQNRDYKKLRVNVSRINEFEDLFKTLYTLYSKGHDSTQITQGDNGNAENTALIKSFLLILLSRFYHALINTKPTFTQTTKDKIVRVIIDYIDSNYMILIDLDSLERKFHFNKYYLSHIFKQLTGFTIMEYAQHRRIIEAQRMLKYTNKDIIEICYDCGFNNIQHFYRVFSKVTGITPYKYRKMG
jgi:AraC-like DNA-binding protein